MKQDKQLNRFKEVAILDVCCSDYFQGYFMPVLTIPVYFGQTTKDLAREIKEAINFDYEYLVNENGYSEKEIKIFERYANKLKRSKKELLGYVSEDIMNDITEEDFEDTNDCYIYLGLCKPVFNNGLKFLN